MARFFINKKKSLAFRLFKLGFFLFLAVFVLIGLMLFLHRQTNVVAGAMQKFLNYELKEHGQVSYRSLKGSLFNSIEIKDLNFVLNERLQISSGYVELRYSLLPLLSGRIQVSRILFDQIKVEVLLPPAEVEIEESAPFNLDSALVMVQRSNFIDSLLSFLPEIQVKDVELFAGSLSMPDVPFTLNEINLKLSAAAISKKSFRIGLDRLQCRWQEKNLSLKKLSFQLAGDLRHLTLNQCEINTDSSRFSLSAYYNLGDTIDASLNIYEFYLNLSDVYKLSGVKELQHGYLSGSIIFSGAPVRFSSQVDLSGNWQDQTVERLSLDMNYDHGAYVVHDLSLRSPGGNVQLQGRGYQLQGAEGRLSFENINLFRFNQNLIPTSIYGELIFDIDDFNLRRPTGTGRLALQHSQFDSISIDSLLFALNSDNGNFEIIKPSFLQFNRHSRFDLEGAVNNKRLVDLTVSTFNNDLSALLASLGIDSIQTTVDGNFHLTGKLLDPNVSAHLWSPRFKYGAVELDSIALTLFTEQVLSKRKGQGVFQISRGKIDQMPLRDIWINASIDSNIIDAPDIHLYSQQDFLKARLNAQMNGQKVTVDLPSFRVEYQQYWLENEGNLRFIIDTSGVSVEQFRLTGPRNSAIEVAGFWDNAVSDLQAYLTFKNIEIEPFEQFWKKRFKLTGNINGAAELITPLHNLNLDVDLSADDLYYNGVAFGDLICKFQYANNLISIKDMTLLIGKGELTAAGDFAFSLKSKGRKFNILEETLANLKITWQDITLEHFSPLFKTPVKPKGLLSGYLEVNGAVDRPFLRHELIADNLQYEHFKIDSLRLFAQYNAGYILIDSLSALVNNTKIDAKGWQQYDLRLSDIDTTILDRPLNLYVHSKGREVSFIGYLNEQLESIMGDYEMVFNIGGTPLKPAITSGWAKLNDGSILLSRVREPLRNVNLDAVVVDSVLTLRHFSAYSREEKDLFEQGWRLLLALMPWTDRKVRQGYVEAKGSIDLADLIRPRLDLTVMMDELYIDYFIENTQLLLTSDGLDISGRDTIFVIGEIYIPKGTYEVDLAQMEKNLYLAPAAVKPTPPFTAVNLDVLIPGNFVITSSPLDLTNNFKMTIMGDLQVIIEPAADETQISGHLEVVSGKYSSWNQNFEVKSGSIDFKNPNKINPDIDIVAAKNVGNRLFEISITGPLEDLKQEIHVTEGGRELELSGPDKITMLTLGADLGQFQSNADSAIRNVGENVATTSLLTAIERSAERYTGLDKVQIGRSQNILDLDKFRLNNGLRDASISFGKYLTSDLYIEYRTEFAGNFPTPRLGWQGGNRLGLEYRINRYWTLDSYYEKTKLGNDAIQIGIRWEYTF